MDFTNVGFLSSDKNMLFSVMFGVIIAEEKGYNIPFWLRCLYTIAKKYMCVCEVYPNLVFLLMYPEGLLVLYIMMSKEDNKLTMSVFDL